MALIPTTYGDNAFQPGVFAETYVPDQLIAGNEKLITDNQTVAQNATVLARGTLLGKVTATGKLIPCVKTAADGSQNPYAILADQTDATGGDVVTGVYVKGEFNINRMTFDASWGASVALAFAALDTPCRSVQLYLKQPIDAADPTENNAAGV